MTREPNNLNAETEAKPEAESEASLGGSPEASLGGSNLRIINKVLERHCPTGALRPAGSYYPGTTTLVPLPVLHPGYTRPSLGALAVRHGAAGR